MRLAITITALATTVSAFAPYPTRIRRTNVARANNALPPSILISEATSEDFGELAKTAAIVLALGGGLIPAAIAGNSAMIGTLTGKRRGGEDTLDESKDPKKSLDPTIADTKNRAYVEDSGASGPTLPGSALLFANEEIPLADVVAVFGRIRDVNSIADWSNLPSTKLSGVSETNPPMWLPRGAFKVNIRKAPWLGWPVDPKTGEPVGGAELKQAEERRISKSGALIGDAALDSVWDSWAWGASIATPDKVEGTLGRYRPNDKVLDMGKFVGAAVRGRSVTAFAALLFIVIQIMVYSSLFVAPILRTFFNIDIGFGQLGTCDPETCTKLF